MLVMALFLRKVNSSQFSMLWWREEEREVKERWAWAGEERANVKRGDRVEHKVGGRYINRMNAGRNWEITEERVNRRRVINAQNEARQCRRDGSGGIYYQRVCHSQTIKSESHHFPHLKQFCVVLIDGLKKSMSLVKPAQQPLLDSIKDLWQKSQTFLSKALRSLQAHLLIIPKTKTKPSRVFIWCSSLCHYRVVLLWAPWT